MSHRIENIVPFSKVRSGNFFRPLKTERIHSLFERREKTVEPKGVFVKIADSHSINILSHADAIFKGDMTCMIYPDLTKAELEEGKGCCLEKLKKEALACPDWEMVNRGNPAHVL